MKDKREPILIFKGKDINIVIDALELGTELYQDDKSYNKDFKRTFNLLKKIKEVIRIE